MKINKLYKFLSFRRILLPMSPLIMFYNDPKKENTHKFIHFGLYQTYDNKRYLILMQINKLTKKYFTHFGLLMAYDTSYLRHISLISAYTNAYDQIHFGVWTYELNFFFFENLSIISASLWPMIKFIQYRFHSFRHKL